MRRFGAGMLIVAGSLRIVLIGPCALLIGAIRLLRRVSAEIDAGPART